MITPSKDKRSLILKAAYDIFLEHGYTQTKISDIAKKANIGKGTVYEYFDSKESIFIALFEEFARTYKQDFERLAQQCAGQSARKKLEAFMKYETDLASFFENEMKLPPSSFLEMELFKTPRFFPLFQRFMQFKFQLVHQCISEGIASGEFTAVDPAVATVSFLGAFAFYNKFRWEKLQESLGEVMNTADYTLQQLSSVIFEGLSNKKVD